MVDAFVGYLSAFVFVSAMIYSAQYADRRRARTTFNPKPARGKTAPRFTGLNVSPIQLSLEEIQAREITRLLNEVALEIANVLRLIQSYIPHRDLPPDGLDRLRSRRSRLEECFLRLLDGDPCLTDSPRMQEEPAIVVCESTRRPIRALPQPKQVPARRVLEIIKVRPRRTNNSFVQ